MSVHKNTMVVVFSLTSAQGRQYNKRVGYISGLPNSQGFYKVTLLPSLDAQGTMLPIRVRAQYLSL